MGRDEMIEAMARATLPALWSSDPVVAHRAASPLKVDLAREGSLASAAIVLRNLEAQGLVVSQGWQPIETAPRDCTWVMCWGPDCLHGIAKFGANPVWAEYPEYTHWQPLLAPPIAALQSGV